MGAVRAIGQDSVAIMRNELPTSTELSESSPRSGSASHHKTILANAAVQILSLLYPFILFAMAAKGMASERFKEYLVLHAVGSAVFAIADAGTHIYFVSRIRDAVNRRAVLKSAVALKLIVLALLALVSAPIANHFFELSFLTMVIVFLIYGAASALNVSFVFHALGKAESIAMASLLGRTIALAVAASILLLGQGNKEIYAAVTGGGFLLTSLFLLPAALRQCGAPQVGLNAHTPQLMGAETSFRLIETILTTAYTTLVTPLGAAIYGASAIAFFTIADRITRSYQALLYSFFLSAHPLLTEGRSMRSALRSATPTLTKLVLCWLPLPTVAVLAGHYLESIFQAHGLSNILLLISPLALLGTINGISLYSLAAPRLRAFWPLVVIAAGSISFYTFLMLRPMSDPIPSLSLCIASSDIVIFFFTGLLIYRRAKCETLK